MQDVRQAPRPVFKSGLIDRVVEVALVCICATVSIYGLTQISSSGQIVQFEELQMAVSAPSHNAS